MLDVMANFVRTLLEGLDTGDQVRIGYGHGQENYCTAIGTVAANDPGSGMLLVMNEDGLPAMLSYRVVQDVTILKKGDGQKPALVVPVPRKTAVIPWYQRELEVNEIASGDNVLKGLFETMPRPDKAKLNGVYDSFRFGVKNSDKGKLRSAAETGKQLLISEYYDKKYDWSDEAALLCGLMLVRVGVYDPEVFLVGERFWEASYSAFRQKNWSDAGVYAAVALLEGDTEHKEALMTILAKATVESDDAAAVTAWLGKAGQTPEGKQMLAELLQYKKASADQGPEKLKLLYTANTMGEELDFWYTEAPERKEEPEKNVTGSDPAGASPKPAAQKVTYTHVGRVLRLQWADQTGTIIDDDGKTWPFRYADLDNPGLRTAIGNCCRADLNGKVYWVRFTTAQGAAKHIQSAETALYRARKTAGNLELEDRYARAVKLCKAAIGTPEEGDALGEMLQYALEQFKLDGDRKALEETRKIALEKGEKLFTGAKPLSAIGQIHFALGDQEKAMECTEQALACPGLPFRLEMTLLTQFTRFAEERMEEQSDKKLARRVEEKAARWVELMRANGLEDEPTSRKILSRLIIRRVKALCILDKPEQAAKALKEMPGEYAVKSETDKAKRLIAETNTRLAPPEPAPVQEAREDVCQPEAAASEPETAEEEETEEPIEPYVDQELSEMRQPSAGEIVDFALALRGEGALSTALAYLKAGSMLRPEVAPVYRMAALAADDPMGDQVYTLDALVEELAQPDQGQDKLKELCMAAAYLRHSFQECAGNGYGADTLRGSIAALNHIPGLNEICDSLTVFARHAGFPMDIYAGYRTGDDRVLEQELSRLRDHAGELYTRYVQTPPRLDAKMARWIETRRQLFSRDSLLGQMLGMARDGDRAALAGHKEAFARLCQIHGGFSQKRLNARAVETVIANAWDEAGKQMPSRKATATPQGSLGNNLRSSVSEVMGLLCRWYELDEQSAGLSGRSEEGRAAYAANAPRLIEQFRALADFCDAGAGNASDQTRFGLTLLGHTARELADKLDGSWTEDRRKFFYADFLRSGEILLDESFLPDLSATFCALEDFNILSRLRRHAQGEKLTLQAHLDRIYGREKQWGNYGTAAQILAYAESGLPGETAGAPENAELFRSQAEKQAQMQLRIFRENYALASSLGQIERGDSFCYHLENTVRYWNARWGACGNYGCIQKLMELGEQQIRRSARRYEQTLNEQLDALVEAGTADFAAHPEYIEAIRDQIARQNFLVAEDWMNQARKGGFHMEQEKPEALRHLERFWNSYANLYNQVADTSRSLQHLVGSRVVRNKDTKGAQLLIDNWLSSSGHTSAARIGNLLDLLGWKNVQAEPCANAADPKTELFCVTREARHETPLHPIAAFGSRATRDGMYAACLYGSYDCERLYQKIRTLDALNGSKVIFLDYALGSTERRLLARKLKRRDSGLSNTYIIIDRVMILYLANNYNENLINRVVMAVGMPFSYDQPYVADSSHTMPPEIFIGRKDELLKIEQPGGVNLIYGGRQLGKSALLKKALGDIDGSQQRRAVLIDLKDCGCAAAAKKLCWELMDVGILPEEEATEDWEVLCRRIRRRLRQEDDVIRYLLVLLDEADAFIADCAGCGYKPLVALKEIQQAMDGRFKFVLAGLHNIVRFNRAVALGQNAVITHLPSLKVTPFRPAEAEELLTGPLSYLGFSFSSKVTVSQILATANYFPGLIQLCGQKLIECSREPDYAGYDLRSTPPYAVSENHLRRVMADREFTDQIQEKFEITLRLDQDQGSCYYPLALLIGLMYYITPSKHGYSARDVLAQAKDLHVSPLADLTVEKIDALMQELQDLNILRAIDRDTYLLSSKNFRDLLGSEEEIFEKLSAMGGEGV